MSENKIKTDFQQKRVLNNINCCFKVKGKQVKTLITTNLLVYWCYGKNNLCSGSVAYCKEARCIRLKNEDGVMKENKYMQYFYNAG